MIKKASIFNIKLVHINSWTIKKRKIEDIFGLKKSEMNKKSSIIIFRSKNNNLNSTVFLFFILRFIKFLSIILRFIKFKQVYNANNFKIFIFLFFKKRSLVIYKFLVRIKYFSNLKNRN